MCFLTLWARGIPGSVISPPLDRMNTGLQHRGYAVLVLPALKVSQHLRCDLLLEGFRSGDERTLRDLQMVEI